MARTTKTTSEVITEATEAVAEKEVVEVKEPVVEKAPTRSKAKQAIAEDELILCMNGTTGRYGYTAKNGYSIDLDEYGDTVEVPFGELKRLMASQQKKHLKAGWLVVLDEEAVELLGLKKDYAFIYDQEQVENLIANPMKIEEIFPKMPEGSQAALLVTAKQMYQNGTLVDLRVVNAIRNIANVNIME